MFARADTFQNLAGLRVVLRLRIARDETGRQRAHTLKEARYAVLEDRDGTKFNARIPCFGLSDFQEVSAKIHHVGFDGTVYLKNVRLRKAR
jgi:hypothetical protein